jgi:5S rRNA maturation endonuclease (ribonuclease M5)
MTAAEAKAPTVEFPRSFIGDLERAVMHRKGRPRGDEIHFQCPLEGHEDNVPSATWNIRSHTWFCHACKVGGGALDLADRLGVDKPPMPAAPKLVRPRRIIAEYNYVDAEGEVLYQVVRFAPKDFRQRHPGANGDWIWNLTDVDLVLYHLPDILSDDDTVWIVEGEKDADLLQSLGLIATTCAMGAGKWRQSYTDTLAGRNVVILPDNDGPGLKHAREVADQLAGAKCLVRLAELPDLPPKGDVSDWLKARSITDLITFVDTVPEWNVSEKPAAPPLIRPVIDAGNQDLEVVSAQAWLALQRANQPPRLFRFGGVPVRIESSEEEAIPVAQILSEDRLGHELARSAEWFKVTQKGEEKPASPPPRVIKDMLAAPSIPLPALISIVQAPVFASDGTLQVQPGYHPAGRTFYAPAAGFIVPPVPNAPTDAEVDHAKSLILDDLLGEFSFINEAERANALALFLDPYIRNLIDGPTPLRLIEAPTPGSGKGLLADVILRAAIGSRIVLMTAPSDDDEWRKRITAQLSQLPAAILIDNLTTALDSGSLAGALTTTWWSDRRLGVSEMVRFPVRCVWLATANNPTMSTELARRTVRIRLDPKVDRPWQRTGFRHEDLRGWADENRPQIVCAALTLVRAWIRAGQPLGKIRLGSFERWSAVHGGILSTIGVSGFLSNLEEFYEAADVEGAIWRQFVDLWFEKFNEREVGVADLFGMAQNVEGFDFGAGSERSQRITFGRQLGQQRDRVIGDCRIVQTRTLQRAKQWRLIKARPGGNPFDVFHAPQHGAEAGDDPWTR